MKASHTASVARSPRTARHGSPGTTRARMNTTKTIPKRTGIVTSSRRTMKRATWRGAPPRADRRRGGLRIRRTGAPRRRPRSGRCDGVADSLRGWRVQEPTPQTGEVLEGTGAPDVQRMLRVPLGRVAHHHVVGVEGGAV